MDREVWLEFLCSPERASRHLSAIGRSVIGANSEAIEFAELDAFLERLDDDEDLPLLGALVDLVTGGYEDFLGSAFPQLLDELANENVPREQVVGPGLRGNPIWHRTITNRLCGSLGAGRYISRTAHRSFDLPENRALAWLVADLIDCVDLITRRVRGPAVPRCVERIGSLCRGARGHHWFGDVRPPRAVTSAMINSLRRHRRPQYREAAILVGKRQAFATRDVDAWWYSLLALLAVNWLEPIGDDDLFELFVLALTIDIIEVELGFGLPTEYGLVAPRRRCVAKFEKCGQTVMVYFDQSPVTVMDLQSEYGKVVRLHHGLVGSARRPDVLVVAEDGNGRRVALIEAKRSRDRRYISDGVYKLFGYMFDYRKVNESGKLSGLVLVPEGIGVDGTVQQTGEVSVVGGDRRGDFVTRLGAALGL